MPSSVCQVSKSECHWKSLPRNPGLRLTRLWWTYTSDAEELAGDSGEAVVGHDPAERTVVGVEGEDRADVVRLRLDDQPLGVVRVVDVIESISRPSVERVVERRDLVGAEDALRR